MHSLQRLLSRPRLVGTVPTVHPFALGSLRHAKARACVQHRAASLTGWRLIHAPCRAAAGCLRLRSGTGPPVPALAHPPPLPLSPSGSGPHSAPASFGRFVGSRLLACSVGSRLRSTGAPVPCPLRVHGSRGPVRLRLSRHARRTSAQQFEPGLRFLCGPRLPFRCASGHTRALAPGGLFRFAPQAILRAFGPCQRKHRQHRELSERGRSRLHVRGLSAVLLSRHFVSVLLRAPCSRSEPARSASR